MKKRILFINNGLYGGGAEKILQIILNNLDPSKYTLTLYSLHNEDLDGTYPRQLNYRYIFDRCNDTDSWHKHIWIKFKNKIKLIIYHNFPANIFYRLFIRGLYDIEIAFIEGYATKIISGSTNKKSRKLAWVHIDLMASHWTKIAYRNFKDELNCYKKFDQILCVSNGVRNSFLKLFSNIPNTSVCYNPIDDVKIKELARKSTSFENWRDSSLTMVSIGRLVEQKGYDRLLKVANRLKTDGFNFSINIIGEGPDREMLEDYIKEYNLESTVNLLGYCNNPFPYLQKSDLFVCSSRTEGYSTAVTEALILGIPVITTDCAGMAEMLDGGKYGIITENSEEGLYNGLKEMLSDNNIQLYKNKATQRAEFFSLEKQMSKIYNLIES